MTNIDMTLQRRAVRRVIKACRMSGFTLRGVNDGGAFNAATTTAAALDHVFGVDTSTIVFTRENKRYGILIVLGNAPDGSEVVADHHDDSGPFTAAIDGAIARHEAMLARGGRA